MGRVTTQPTGALSSKKESIELCPFRARSPPSYADNGKVIDATLTPELEEVLLALLEDETTSEGEYEIYPSSRDSIMQVVWALFSDREAMQAMASLYDQETLRERMLAFAKATISKEEVPPWPSTDQLDEARKKALVEACETQSAESFLPWFRKLPDDERLHVYEHLRKGGSKVPLQEASAHIGRIKLETKAIRNAYPWDDLIGKRLAYEAFESVVSKLRSVAVDSPVFVQYGRGTFYEGRTLLEMRQAGQWTYYLENMPQDSVLGVMLQSSSGEQQLFWGPEKETPTNPDEVEGFKAAFEASRAAFQLSLTFMIKPLPSDDNEETTP